MKNIFRFLIGILATIGVLILVIILLAVLTPFIILGGVLFFILIIIVVIIGIFAFIWYMSRNEKPKAKSKNYSISQGRNA